MGVLCVLVVVLVGFLICIIFSELNKDDENEKILRDFFDFSEKSTQAQVILLLLLSNFSLSIMFLLQVGKKVSILISRLFIETITIGKSSILDSKLMVTR